MPFPISNPPVTIDFYIDSPVKSERAGGLYTDGAVSADVHELQHKAIIAVYL